MVDNKKLGKGLDALLSPGSSETMAGLLGKTDKSRAPAATSDKDGDLKNIPIDLIQRGKYQPRTNMHEEALEELAASIRKQGVMQPIVIRPISSEKYEIIAGERRWRASQLAGLDKIPAIIKPVGDEAAIAMALIENIQRENLNPIEEAMALKRLQDEFELTQQEVADAVGKSRVTITNLIRPYRAAYGCASYVRAGRSGDGACQGASGFARCRATEDSSHCCGPRAVRSAD